MADNAESKYFQFPPDSVTEVTVLSATAREESIHWVGGKPAQCYGSNCRLCNDGLPVRKRELLDVLIDGNRKIITLPERGFDRFIDEYVRPHSLEGAVVRIRARGSGSGRRYGFEIVSLKPGRTSEDNADAIGYLRYIEEHLYSLAREIREYIERYG